MSHTVVSWYPVQARKNLDGHGCRIHCILVDQIYNDIGAGSTKVSSVGHISGCKSQSNHPLKKQNIGKPLKGCFYTMNLLKRKLVWLSVGYAEKSTF